MDFRDLAIRDRDDAGYAVDILHPITGDPWTEGGKPSRVIVRGATSRAAAAALADMNQRGMLTGETDTREKLQARVVQTALPWIAGFENCIRDGKPMTVEDAEWWLDAMIWKFDEAKLANKDLPYHDKFVGYPFPAQVLRAVEASKAALGNA